MALMGLAVLAAALLGTWILATASAKERPPNILWVLT